MHSPGLAGTKPQNRVRASIGHTFTEPTTPFNTLMVELADDSKQRAESGLRLQTVTGSQLDHECIEGVGWLRKECVQYWL